MIVQPHYHARITLLPHGDGWPDVVAPVLRWLVKREAALLPEYRLPLLLEGSEIEEDNTRIESARHSDATGRVLAWALAYTYPDRDKSAAARRWRVDIAMTRCESAWNVAVTLSHHLSPGYVGPEPAPPNPAVPFCVRHLLADARWRVRNVSSFPLIETPHILESGQGDRLAAALHDPGRCHPIVYVSRPPEGVAGCDAAILARLLLGSAVIVTPADALVERELDALLPDPFRCYGGAVRVYLPQVRFDDVQDAQRHRYVPLPDLTALGAEAVPMLVRAVTRYLAGSHADLLLSVADVQTREREMRLADLRYDAAHISEYVRLLEDEYTTQQHRIRDLTAEVRQLVEERALLSETLGTQVRALTRELEAAYSDLQRMTAHTALDTAQARRLVDLRELPETLPAMLDTIRSLFPSRVHVTERARASATDAAIAATRDARHGWRLLYALATTLYDLIFADAPAGDLRVRFRDLTGIDLALSEGRMTNDDARLVALRHDVDDLGQPIDITPHLKWGDRPPRLLRVHFAIDRARRLLIIGHCGDHLETSGTLRSR